MRHLEGKPTVAPAGAARKAAGPAPAPHVLHVPQAAMPRYMQREGGPVPVLDTHTRVTARHRAAASQPAEVAAEQAAQAFMAGATAPAQARLAPAGGVQAHASRLAARAGGGQGLPLGLAQDAAARLGVDSSTVRVHADAQADRTARAHGANAVTAGRNIFFAAGRYAPDTPAGQRLLAHELAHVAQQGGEPRAAQCDIAQSDGVTLGVFETSMVVQPPTAASGPGLMGTIRFDPDPHGPYSAEIGLIQTANVADVAGTTNAGDAGGPVDWSNVGGGNPEAGRNELQTTGLDGAPRGTFIDSATANARGNSVGPNYIEHFTSPPPANQFGWLRSPTDVGPASLWDFPQWGQDSDFTFETVAKGTDNQQVYGALHWGFSVRNNRVVPGSDTAAAVDTASATFDEALERFRGFFVHEPVVLYFDTDSDVPISGEEAKFADVPDYLTRYPDVRVIVEGHADVRGSEPHNFDLANRRAASAANLLELAGVAADRMDFVFGFGETDQFSQHGTAPGAAQPIDAGRLRANQRVVISFEHSVSNHPIVMP